MTVKFRVLAKSKGDTTNEIHIYDDIGASWFGGIGAKDVIDALKEIGKVDEITCRINSYGGDVFEAFAIYNALVRNSAKIVTAIDGMAASAASYIAMAGNTIEIADNAWMMIHNPWGMAMGDAQELRRMADQLDEFKGSIRDIYVARTGVDPQKCAAMMDAETWMDAKECVAQGFADTTVENLKAAASAHFRADRHHFAHMPEKLRNHIERTKPAPDMERRATFARNRRRIEQLTPRR